MPIAYQPISAWELTLACGPMMALEALLLIVSLYVAIARYAALRRALRVDATFMKRIKDYVHDGEVDSARLLCKKSPTPCGRVILKGISRLGRSMGDVVAALDAAAALECSRLRRGVGWLATVAAAAPMLGLLGAVVELAVELPVAAAAAPDALAASAGPSLALVAAGMAVGVIAWAGYNLLVAKANRVARLLVEKKLEFLDLLNEPAG